MTASIKSSLDGTQAIIQVNGVDKVVVDSGGINAGSYKAGSIVPADLAQKPTVGTSVPTTSGTAHDITGIPSWVQRVTVTFSGVSTNGTSNWLLQLGAGSIQTTGYASTGTSFGASSTASTATTSGILIRQDTPANVSSGSVTFTKQSGNTWVATGALSASVIPSLLTSGGVTLSGALDRIRLTTVGGTDTFDAGSINILYE